MHKNRPRNPKTLRVDTVENIATILRVSCQILETPYHMRYNSLSVV